MNLGTRIELALLQLRINKLKQDSNDCHDEQGKFCSKEGSSSEKSSEKSSTEKSSLGKETRFSSPKAPEDFIDQRDRLPKDLRAFLTLYSSEEYIKMGAKLHLSPTKQSGFALKPDGELISVFSLPGAHEGHSAIEAAIKAGAKKLDCLGESLRERYEAHGFKVVEVYSWNEEYRPGGWNEKKYGRPNVYYMELKKDGT